MLSEIKSYPVNWVDGMKISKKNFIEIENFVQDFIRDSIALRTNEYNYGLLTSPTNTNSYEIFVHVGSQNLISVKMTFCRAITAAGHRIELIKTTAEDAIAMRIPFASIIEQYALQATQTNELYITLSINPDKRVPFGEAINETPPRYPFAKADYRLSVIPADYIASSEYSSNHLIVAKLIYKNNEVRQDADYIPPASTINSTSKLVEWHSRLEGLILNIENNCIKIIHKIKLKTERKSNLSENIAVLVDRILLTIAQNITDYRVILPDEPPLKTISFFTKLSKVFKVYIDTLPSSERAAREEILKYFSSWAEVPPSIFDTGMDNIIYLKYNHHEIKAHFERIYEVWKVIDNLFETLTKLEYIGEQRGKQIFVIENPVHKDKAPIEPIKSKFNPLD